MRRVVRAAGIAAVAAGCLESTLPNLGAGALRPPDIDSAVLLSVGDLELPQTTYVVRHPLAAPELVFDGPDGAMLRLRVRDLTQVGTVTTDGQLVVFEWTAPGGRAFSPESVCALTVFEPLGASTPPWIEGRTICEARAADGTRATVAVVFAVAEP